MRHTTDNPLDPLGQLGAPVRSPQAAPAPAPVAPGIIRQADGKLATTPTPAPIVWIPTPREEDEA